MSNLLPEMGPMVLPSRTQPAAIEGCEQSQSELKCEAKFPRTGGYSYALGASGTHWVLCP